MDLESQGEGIEDKSSSHRGAADSEVQSGAGVRHIRELEES